jgi:hypothetical protein
MILYLIRLSGSAWDELSRAEFTVQDCKLTRSLNQSEFPNRKYKIDDGPGGRDNLLLGAYYGAVEKKYKLHRT